MPGVPGADPALLSIGAGYIYMAPIGTAEPTPTVVGSVFTDTLAGAWVPLGYTDEGIEHTEDINTSDIVPAEEFYPVATLTTAKTGRINFTLWQISLTNIKRAMNGGTITTTGATTTALNQFDPVAPGSEIRQMVLWEDENRTQRMLFRRCINVATVSIARRKAPNNSALLFQMALEKPSGVQPFTYWTAGVLRA